MIITVFRIKHKPLHVVEKGDERVKAYDTFKELCKEHNVTPHKVSVEAGVPSSTVSEWGKGMYTPKIDKLCKIANYFEVPVTVFIEGYDG